MTITLQPTDAPDTESIVRRIIAELDANPGVREPLLRALLTEEFLLMPARLTRVEEIVVEIQDDMAGVKGTVGAVQGDVKTLQGTMETVQGDVKTLQGTMETVQGDVKTLQGTMETVQGDVKTLQGTVETVQGDVKTLQGTMGTVQNEVARLKGGELETQFAHRATSILNRMFGFLRCRVVHGRVGSGTHIANQFSDQIVDAYESGLITERQLRRIYDTDVIARCLRPSDSATVWVAVEVAGRLDSADIDRAAQSAAALRQAFGQDVLAVAAGERIDPPDRARAAQAGVALFQMGEDDAEEPE